MKSQLTLSALCLAALLATGASAEQSKSALNSSQSKDNAKVEQSLKSGIDANARFAKSAANKTNSKEVKKAAKRDGRDSQVLQVVTSDEGVEAKSGADKPKFNSKSTERKVRPEQVTKSTRSHEFWVYDAYSYLIDDADGDGFYSEFEIQFDADTIYDFAELYAVMYISRNGGPWIEYHVTNVFDVFGESGTDDYSVTTVLNFDYPTDEYDILIDLYEYGYAGVVATYSSEDDFDLAYLPLEDRLNEDVYDSGYWFYDIQLDLLDDFDNDGFYSSFGLGFDIDSDFQSSEVYVEVLFLNEFDEWELEYTSNDITIEGNSTLDRVQLEFEWNSGYPTGYYDFLIVVRDALSNEILTEASTEFDDLYAVPLESLDRDDTPNGGGSNNGGGSGSSTSYESGGSLPPWGLVMLLPMLLLRRKSK
ncbi:MAG: GlyGly-CTERM sorting domain-containing protein [Gammaproteobacteria bacterium]|nr:GlyGly-CTERM sorting domain-containing protein [Gammaproteobacteria bacterium]